MKSPWHWILIVASVALLALYYGYPRLLTLEPQSVHHWRQSDCTSLTLNYYQQDLPFWKPKTHGLVSDYGTTGYNAPSEVPLYYWCIAQLYHLFGPHQFLLRGFNTLLFLAGIVAFILLLFRISKNLPWSILLGLFLFTSPILVFYGNNFLTNAPAFGMALCGLSAFIAYVHEEKRKYWWWTVLFFLIAGSLKLPGLFLFLALGAVVVLHPKSIAVLSRARYLLSAAIILVPLGAWVIYARQFNDIHHTTYFSTTAFPIWEYSASDLQFIVSEIYNSWWGEHFHPFTCIGIFLLLIFLILKRRQIPRISFLLLMYLLGGLLLFTLLQFYTFMQHDYYTINMFMLVAIVLMIFTQYLHKRNPAILRNPLVLIMLALFLGGNVYYAKERLDFRYGEWPNQYRSEYRLLYAEETDSWLTEIGVTHNDTVIFVADPSHNSLYLLNRYGWTTHKMDFKDTTQIIRFNQSEEGVQRSIDNGAEYLLVHGVQTLYNRTYLHPFLTHLTARRGELFVFDLKAREPNFTLPQPAVFKNHFFDFENPADTLFVTAHKIVADPEDTGNRVVEATTADEFLGMLTLDSLQKGMAVEVTVWIKTHRDARVIPVISSEEPGLAFEQKQDIIDEKGKWRLLRQQLRINQSLAGKPLKIFLWNPGKEAALFDSVDVKVFEPNPLW